MLISVIVPVYNIEKYIGKCIESIQKQTYSNLEIILVDDGSTDESGKICDDYATKDSRIRVVHKDNGGSVSARKAGVNVARGEYSLCVDGDDWVEHDYIEHILLHILHKPDIVAVLGYFRDYENGLKVYCSDYSKHPSFSVDKLYLKDEIRKYILPSFIDTDHFFCSELPIVLWSYCFKTELLKACQMQENDDVTLGEDVACVMRCLLNAGSLIASDESGYHYVQRNDSMVHFKSTNTKDELRKTYENFKNIHTKDYRDEDLNIKKLFHIFYVMMLKNYSYFVDKTSDFLFPYSNITRGMKIFIYGTGTFGKQVIDTVIQTEICEIIGCSDKSWKSFDSGIYNAKKQIKVFPPEEIKKLDFDYLIIAVVKYDVRMDIYDELINLGVNKEKIAKINLSLFTLDNLPFLYDKVTK